MYLSRYHDITISTSGVWRILKRVDLSRLPAYQRYQRPDRKWKPYLLPAGSGATSSPRSMTAPASAFCASMTS